MDPSIPRGAAILLGFVYETETGRKPPQCYDVIYGHRQSALSKPLTTMTVGEVVDEQAVWSSKAWAAKFGSTKASSAAGAPQFIRATLIDLAKELRLRGTQIFDGNLQDRLAYHLLKRRGYESFMAGQMSREEFGKRLAMEWASLPVLASTRGATRMIGRGQSYYAGDGLNKALVDPAEFEKVLTAAKSAGNGTQTPGTPKPAPSGKAGILAAILAALAAAGAWLANIPCNLFGIFCGG
ncbi:hypothetical protein [Chelativorans sp. Marseille-P2723]|uniref:hypothetical protein n=1 Tax=Chelativorans sp. Marseille-P2723 TaxID=2709133 RepID=UPI00156E793F|nr:hypothetical protein [Chelativorans sp. Marseille-P2723]